MRFVSIPLLWDSSVVERIDQKAVAAATVAVCPEVSALLPGAARLAFRSLSRPCVLASPFPLRRHVSLRDIYWKPPPEMLPVLVMDTSAAAVASPEYDVIKC